MRSLPPAETARIQRKLGLAPDGRWTEEATDALRAFQRKRGLIVTGELDLPTSAALDNLSTHGLVPTWFAHDEQTALDRLLGGHDENTIRRYQSAAGLPVTGRVSEEMAIRLGE